MNMPETSKKKGFLAFLQRIDWSQIPKAVYVRYILMIVAALNTILTRLGVNPINVSEAEVYQMVSDFAMVAILLVNTWKNNSVTKEAIQSDQYLKQLLEEESEDPADVIYETEEESEDTEENTTEESEDNESSDTEERII